MVWSVFTPHRYNARSQPVRAQGLWLSGVLCLLPFCLLFGTSALSLAQTPQAPGHAAPVSRPVLNLLGWSDYIDPRILTAFTAKTGIEIVYDTYPTTNAALERLQSQPTGFDLIILAGQALPQAIRTELIQPLPRDRIEKYRAAWPEATERLKALDAGNRHAAIYSWGTFGLAINQKKIQERLGPAAAINSWDMLFKPEFSAKLKDCGIALPQTADDIMPVALLQATGRPESRDPKDHQKAFDLLMRTRSQVRLFSAAEHINGLASGDLCIAASSSMETMQARRRAQDTRNNIEIMHIIPREGAPIWFDVLAIPADSKNSDNALAFIDFLMDAETAARTSDFLLATTGQKHALASAAPETRATPGIAPDEAALKRSFVTFQTDEATRRNLHRLWQRIRTGK